MDRRTARGFFALLFAGVFGTILVLIWSIDLRNPLPILIELALFGSVIGLALWRRRVEERSRGEP